MLKKELSAQWDHIDFNTLLPDSTHVLDDPRNRDHVSHTTSTATEREEPMSDAEEPLTKCGVMYSSTSSLSSAATACSPPQLPPPPPPPPPPGPADLHGHGGEGPKSTPPTPVMQLPVSAHVSTCKFLLLCNYSRTLIIHFSINRSSDYLMIIMIFKLIAKSKQKLYLNA